MAIPLISGQSATGAGANTVVFREVPANLTFQLTTTGSPATVIVDVEGSLDGIDWFQLAQHTAAGDTDMFHINGKPVNYLRGNVDTISGGTVSLVFDFKRETESGSYLI